MTHDESLISLDVLVDHRMLLLTIIFVVMLIRV